MVFKTWNAGDDLKKKNVKLKKHINGVPITKL